MFRKVIYIIIFYLFTSVAYTCNASEDNSITEIYIVNNTNGVYSVNGSKVDARANHILYIKPKKGKYLFSTNNGGIAIGKFGSNEIYTVTISTKRKLSYFDRINTPDNPDYVLTPVIKIEKGITSAIIETPKITKDITLKAFDKNVNIDIENLEQQGALYYKYKWYQQAHNNFLFGSEKGNAYSMFMAGLMLFNGDGMDVNFSAALSYFKKGADLNDDQSIFYIGVMYYKGLGVAKDYNQSFLHFERSASLKNTDAMTNLGVMYHKGRGVTKDLPKACLLWSKAADSSNLRAEGKLKNAVKNNICATAFLEDI